tara:strand:- start:364 stop:1116 length:753 start_codon:yes stop_codon:yes gene_type:complete
MLRSRIIPCLLLTDSGLIKTVNFKRSKYIGDVLNAVKIFNEKKVDELILLDIEASLGNKEPNYERLKVIANESRMPLTYGGGIKNVTQAIKIISLGYEKVSISSSAITNPQLISEIALAIGSQSVVVTIDYKSKRFSSGHNVFINNGTKRVDVNPLEFCTRAVELGAGEILFNSIEKDGTLSGYDLEFAKEARSKIRSQISFLGGAGSIYHLQELIDNIGIVGAVAGSMFVLKGSLRAVLLSYQRPSRLN